VSGWRQCGVAVGAEVDFAAAGEVDRVVIMNVGSRTTSRPRKDRVDVPVALSMLGVLRVAQNDRSGSCARICV